MERQLARNLLLQVNYMGSQSYHLIANTSGNQFHPQVCNDPAGCASEGTLGAVGRVPQGMTYMPPFTLNPLCPNGQQKYPNCYVSYTSSSLFLGTSSYHAGSVSLVQRLSHGLSFKANYTFGKIMDIQTGISQSDQGNNRANFMDLYNPRLDKGISGFSLKHQFNANFTYELPFGRYRKGLGNKVFGGWQWNGIFSARSGFPITFLDGQNRSGTGNTNTNPDAPNPNPAFHGRVILGTPKRWYDPHAFVLPIAGTFGTVGRGVYLGPGQTTFDTSLFKKISINDRWNLQFRAEVFNLFNHANFGIPNLTVFSGAAYNASAGVITTTTTTSRQMQFALKLSF